METIEPIDVDSTERSGIFGELVGMAAPDIKAYRGDLYHDARWIAEHVPDRIPARTAFVFYFGWRESGTSIGTDLHAVRYGNDHVVRITLTTDIRGGYSWGGSRWLRLHRTITRIV